MGLIISENTKKHIDIVGIGTGDGTLTEKGRQVIEKANLCIGAGRMLEICAEYIADKNTVNEYDAQKIRDILDKYFEEDEAGSSVILVSGDTGFYSATSSLIKVLDGMEVSIYPGISSVSSMSAKIAIPWQDMKLVSCHGRECNIVDTVRRNKSTFALTGGNVAEILTALADAGYGMLGAYVGQRLDMADESIVSGKVSELMVKDFDTLAVLVVLNDEYEDSISYGIDDSKFVRGDVPMTKSEIRAVTMSKLGIEPDDICYDYGCGTGSVTVEMALAAYRGHVYAIDKNEEAVKLTSDNIRQFHIGNVTVVNGNAPDDLVAKAPSKAFIGGSTGRMEDMIKKLISLNPDVRIVINAIAIETLMQAVKALEDNGFTAQVTQMGVSRSKRVGTLNMMMAENSVYIIKGERI